MDEIHKRDPASGRERGPPNQNRSSPASPSQRAPELRGNGRPRNMEPLCMSYVQLGALGRPPRSSSWKKKNIRFKPHELGFSPNPQTYTHTLVVCAPRCSVRGWHIDPEVSYDNQPLLEQPVLDPCARCLTSGGRLRCWKKGRGRGDEVRGRTPYVAGTAFGDFLGYLVWDSESYHTR